jgi:hypothetical protein
MNYFPNTSIWTLEDHQIDCYHDTNMLITLETDILEKFFPYSFKPSSNCWISSNDHLG